MPSRLGKEVMRKVPVTLWLGKAVIKKSFAGGNFNVHRNTVKTSNFYMAYSWNPKLYTKLQQQKPKAKNYYCWTTVVSALHRIISHITSLSTTSCIKMFIYIQIVKNDPLDYQLIGPYYVSILYWHNTWEKCEMHHQQNNHTTQMLNCKFIKRY